MTATSNTVRRCSACGNDLHGKVSYPIAHLHYCVNMHCLSKGFVDNIHILEASERERVTNKVHDIRCQARRQIVMEKVYGVGPTL
jgi:hypothetical protein